MAAEDPGRLGGDDNNHNNNSYHLCPFTGSQGHQKAETEQLRVISIRSNLHNIILSICRLEHDSLTTILAIPRSAERHYYRFFRFRHE